MVIWLISADTRWEIGCVELTQGQLGDAEAWPERATPLTAAPVDFPAAERVVALAVPPAANMTSRAAASAVSANRR